jgi:hypothetical protein
MDIGVEWDLVGGYREQVKCQLLQITKKTVNELRLNQKWFGC